jgi:hypothetical protein
MHRLIRAAFVAPAALVIAAAPAETPDAQTIIARAFAAAGGESWANARTLVLEGRAVFYGPEGAAPRSTADSYRMWRVFDPGRQAAHGAEGKVRIDARSGDRLLFQAGFDGVETWNEKGPVPKAQADAFWASNFGFGIIRHARKPGFTLARLPDDSVGAHPVYTVRLTDPAGTATLFGIDKTSYAIRRMGFASPRGWHERVYDDFEKIERPRWLQARHVTLYYNGVKANEVFWTRTQVDVPIEPGLFAAPARP